MVIMFIGAADVAATSKHRVAERSMVKSLGRALKSLSKIHSL
jgi:hypothetical protein